MTRITVKSEIVVGKRTANGNVYTKEALEGSIRHFNEKATATPAPISRLVAVRALTDSRFTEVSC